MRGTGTGTSTQSTLLAEQTASANLLAQLSSNLGINSFDANGDGKTTNAEVLAKLNDASVQSKVTGSDYLKSLLEANNFERSGQGFAVKGATSDTVLAQNNVGTSQNNSQGAGIV